jgi:hypothetical protein
MKFQIAFLRSPATPSGEALDAALAAALKGLEQRRDGEADYLRLPDDSWVEFWRESDADWFFVLSPVTAGDGLSDLVIGIAERTAAMFTADFDDSLYRPQSAAGLEPLIDAGDMPLREAPRPEELDDILLGCIAQFSALEATEAKMLREGSTLPVFEELALGVRDGATPLDADSEPAADPNPDPIVEGPPAPGFLRKLSDTLFGKKV